MKDCSKCGLPMTPRPDNRWRCRSCENDRYQRWREANLVEARRRNRENAKKRRANPETATIIRAQAKACYENGGREREREARQNRKHADFFGYHVQFARRFNSTITVSDLRDLWDEQGGRCGLTGWPLTASPGEAHLDHIVPQSRGGGHDLSNLRWVTAAANHAKRNLTDDEFRHLCSSVAEWIGRRIQAV